MCLLFAICFIFYTHFIAFNVGGDALSQYYPAIKFLEDDSLNLWNQLNNKYDTYYFKLTFSDEVIAAWEESYPMQALGTILLNIFAIGIFGNDAFFYVNPFFASVCVIFIYMIVRELTDDRIVATVSSLTLFSMPIFVFWSIIPQNIIPATCFLVMSLYFIMKFKDRNKLIYVFISGTLLAYSTFSRLPFILFAPAYLAYFFNSSTKYKLELRPLMCFTLPVIITSILIILFNIRYFNDPFFIGYLHTHYHPMVGGSDLIVSTTDTYLLANIPTDIILNSTKLFFDGSAKIFHPLIFVSLIGLLLKSKYQKIKLFQFYFVYVLFISLFYYGMLEPSLWKPSNEEYAYSLSLVFFRYLLPVYVLSVVALSFTLNFILKNMPSRAYYLATVYIVFILAVINVNIPISYEGGASLKWHEDINSKIIDYSFQLPNYIEKDSIILYATREPFSYTYPNFMDYNWFYYDGVPPDYREKHTTEVVEKLLKDDRTVYFVQSDAPYDTLSKDMYYSLNNTFELHYVEGTYFPRMKTRFYSIELPQKINGSE